MIKIRPITMNDYKYVLNWSTDKTFCHANGWKIDRKPEELYDWWFNQLYYSSREFVRLGIEQDGKLIGYGDMADMKNHTAELGIAIGERMLWSQGIGTKAASDLMKYGVKKYGIAKYTAETHENNQRSRKMLEKLGFQETSRTGKEEYLGEYVQLIQYVLRCNGL
ncbi:MAG: GNAT family N-acetyltransferase [Cytobacillus gottheilii]|uniref:GNAT family N-acetyltransferase n=1 Tax=Cytobacillus gottheilii TaxID=859144 RepID=UPI000B165520|nr:GNAT family N-acetyltransferase [Cytobacillus gottheilii]